MRTTTAITSRGDDPPRADAGPAPVPTGSLTPNQVAKVLRCSPDRVRALIAAGELPAIDMAGRRGGRPRYIVLPDQLAAFVRSRTVSAPPPKPARKPRLKVLRDFYP